MILQALKDYYDRKAADPESGIAPPGWSAKALPFLIVLNADGSVVNIEDTQEMDGRMKRAKVFLVPQEVKRSSGIAANFLWDNVEYVTGTVCKGKTTRVAQQFAAFRERLASHQTLPAIDAITPIIRPQTPAPINSGTISGVIRRCVGRTDGSGATAAIRSEIFARSRYVNGSP